MEKVQKPNNPIARSLRAGRILWINRFRCHVAISCSAFLGVVGIAASFGTCVDSLVVVGVRLSYISWFRLGLVGSWQVVGLWYLGWGFRTVYASSIVVGSPVGRRGPWSSAPRNLWMRGTRRSCDVLYLLCLGTKDSMMCLACSICEAAAVWLFYCAVFCRLLCRLCSGWGGDRLLPIYVFPVASGILHWPLPVCLRLILFYVMRLDVGGIQLAVLCLMTKVVRGGVKEALCSDRFG
jgi:hypothetical protein